MSNTFNIQYIDIYIYRYLFIVFIFLLIHPTYSQDVIWNVQHSSASTSGMNIDRYGNSYVVGWDRAKESIDGNIIDFTPTEGAYIFKMNAAGEYVWHDFIENGLDERLTDVSSQGDFVYAVGATNAQSLAIQGFTLTDSYTYYNLFVVKYTNEGNLVWAINTDWRNTTDLRGLNIFNDVFGNIYVVGDAYGVSGTSGGATFRWGNVVLEHEYDFKFLFKLNADGIVQWGHRLEKLDRNNNNRRQVAVNDYGYCTTTYEIFDPDGYRIAKIPPPDHYSFINSFVSFDENFNIYKVIVLDKNLNEYLIQKIDTTGTVLKEQNIIVKNNNRQLLNYIDVGEEDNIYVTGVLWNDSTYLDSNLLINEDLPNSNAFIAKYNMNDGFEWIQQGKRPNGNINGFTFSKIITNSNGQYWISGNGGAHFDNFSTSGLFVAKFGNCVNLNTELSINIDTVANTFCEGEPLFLTAPVGFDHYMWSTEDTLPTLSLTDPEDYYWLFVEDSLGCVDKLEINIILNRKPEKPTIIELLKDTLLQCSVEADSYQWYMNGEEIQNYSRELSTQSRGMFSVRAINGSCESEISDTFSNIILSAMKFQDQEIEIYPNPTLEEFTVHMPLISNYKISLFGIDGHQLDFREFDIDGKTKNIKIEHTEGIIVVRVSKKGQHTYLKVIINK